MCNKKSHIPVCNFHRSWAVHSSHVNLVKKTLNRDMKEFKKTEYRNDAKKRSQLQYTPLEILSAFKYEVGSNE